MNVQQVLLIHSGISLQSESIVVNEQKEHAAIESLYRTKYRVLLHTAFVFVHNDEVASDIVGEAFLSLIEHRHNLDPDKYFYYLYSIVHNKSLDYRKSAAFRSEATEKIKAHEYRMMEHYTRSIESAGFNTVFCNEIMNICNERLRKFPEISRKVFMMSRKQGMSRKEISQALGISENTVRYEQSKVLEELRAALKDYGMYTPIIVAIAPINMFQ